MGGFFVMGEFYRRHLPHYHPFHAVFFVTFRLINSLPIAIIDHLKHEYDSERELLRLQKENPNLKRLPQDFYRHCFEVFDEFLDKQQERNCWLKDKRVAQLVADAIHYRDQKEYDLICYCIMPNHVHLVIGVGRSDAPTYMLNRQTSSDAPTYIFNRQMLGDSPTYKSLTKILQSLKSYTAIRANRILHRTGPFWQGESYDHVVRNEKELNRTIQYVLNNPLKAGLVEDAKDWKFSYCKYVL
jgi:REP-associated tyrosine transposase